MNQGFPLDGMVAVPYKRETIDTVVELSRILAVPQIEIMALALNMGVQFISKERDSIKMFVQAFDSKNPGGN